MCLLPEAPGPAWLVPLIEKNKTSPQGTALQTISRVLSPGVFQFCSGTMGVSRPLSSLPFIPSERPRGWEHAPWLWKLPQPSTAVVGSLHTGSWQAFLALCRASLCFHKRLRALNWAGTIELGTLTRVTCPVFLKPLSLIGPQGSEVTGLGEFGVSSNF